MIFVGGEEKHVFFLCGFCCDVFMIFIDGQKKSRDKLIW